MAQFFFLSRGSRNVGEVFRASRRRYGATFAGVEPLGLGSFVADRLVASSKSSLIKVVPSVVPLETVPLRTGGPPILPSAPPLPRVMRRQMEMISSERSRTAPNSSSPRP